MGQFLSSRRLLPLQPSKRHPLQTQKLAFVWHRKLLCRTQSPLTSIFFSSLALCSPSKFQTLLSTTTSNIYSTSTSSATRRCSTLRQANAYKSISDVKYHSSAIFLNCGDMPSAKYFSMKKTVSFTSNTLRRSTLRSRFPSDTWYGETILNVLALNLCENRQMHCESTRSAARTYAVTTSFYKLTWLLPKNCHNFTFSIVTHNFARSGKK